LLPGAGQRRHDWTNRLLRTIWWSKGPDASDGLRASSLISAVALTRRYFEHCSDKKAAKVRKLHAEGLSYRLIARNVGLSKNTVMGIVRRGREMPTATATSW
jgi:DNA-directed RNA polymerase specialized sigma24 family protein